jgi:hypothetical protein
MEPETAEVLALAREWRTLASEDLWVAEQHRTINRFLKLWIAINALYALTAPRGRGDRDQLRTFAILPAVKEAHEENLNNPVYYRAVESLATRGVYNFLSERFVVVSDVRDAPQVLDAVYQVRCNLFHGKKSPTNLRDAQLVQAAANVVSGLLDRVLADDRLWQTAAV